MLHLRHMAAVVEEDHVGIRELPCRPSGSPGIDEDVVLAVDRQDRLADLPSKPPWATRTPIRVGRKETAKRSQEGIGRVGQGVTLTRLGNERIAERLGDATGVGRARIESHPDSLLGRDLGVTAHKRLAEPWHRDDRQMRIAPADPRRRQCG